MKYQPYPEWGVGLQLGKFTGITASKKFSKTKIITGAVHWDLEKPSLILSGDLLTYSPQSIDLYPERLDYFVGIGATFYTSNPKASIDIPFGVSYFNKTIESTFFWKFVPTLSLLPKIEFDAGLSIGIRYYGLSSMAKRRKARKNSKRRRRNET